jgi:hypothetical protein
MQVPPSPALLVHDGAGAEVVVVVGFFGVQHCISAGVPGQ